MTTQPQSLLLESSEVSRAIDARLSGPQHHGTFVAPMARLLEQLRDRVDDRTWSLILDLELRAGLEVSTAVEIGLELGYERGRAAALMDDPNGPGRTSSALADKLAELLADTSIDYPDVMLALLSALRATVTTAQVGRRPRPSDSPAAS